MTSLLRGASLTRESNPYSNHDSDQFLSRELFLRMLQLERKRSERSGRAFVLMLLKSTKLLRSGNPHTLNKVMSTKLEKSGSPAAALAKNFTWTNDDQNLVAKYIAEDKMTPAAAAKKWVDANEKTVAGWIK